MGPITMVCSTVTHASELAASPKAVDLRLSDDWEAFVLRLWLGL